MIPDNPLEMLALLKGQIENAERYLSNPIASDQMRSEHPNALALIGDFAIYRRFPLAEQSLREHANEALKPVPWGELPVSGGPFPKP